MKTPTTYLAALITSVLMVLAAPPVNATAAVHDWAIMSTGTNSRITSAVLRYYSVVSPDSLSVRYIRNNMSDKSWRVRAQTTSNDEDGRILFLGLGQLRLYSTASVRIALGDRLYSDVLASRRLPGTDVRPVYITDLFTSREWTGRYRVVWSMMERLDVRIDDQAGVFAQLGAPESMKEFWQDGTARIGYATPSLEAAVLVPFSGGATAIGPIGARRLMPAAGASLRLFYGPFDALLRVGLPFDYSLDATRSIDRTFVHTRAARATYRHEFVAPFGTVMVEGGGSFEQFDEVRRVDNEIQSVGYVQRLAPVARIAYSPPDGNVLFDVETSDLSVRATFGLHLSRSLWLESRVTANDLLRDSQAFENATTLFITPIVRF